MNGPHAASGGRATYQPHGGHLVALVLQHLAVHVHREHLLLGAHAHQVETHGAVGTDVDIWREMFVIYLFGCVRVCVCLSVHVLITKITC